jgi:hypothetical protein
LLPTAHATETKEDALEHLFKKSKRIEAFETIALRLVIGRDASGTVPVAADRGSRLLLRCSSDHLHPDHMFVKPAVEFTHPRSTKQAQTVSVLTGTDDHPKCAILEIEDVGRLACGRVRYGD